MAYKVKRTPNAIIANTHISQFFSIFLTDVSTNEPEKPPPNLHTYFAKYIHKGEPHEAQKAFHNLTNVEQKRMRLDLELMGDDYVTDLKKYLASLPHQDATAYVSWFSPIYRFSF